LYAQYNSHIQLITQKLNAAVDIFAKIKSISLLLALYYIDMLYIDVLIAISDNALLTQSRFVLMESILMHFSLLGLLCIVKFRKVMDRPTSVSWWIWLILGIVNLTCALWY